jgi:hypothetical protein
MILWGLIYFEGRWKGWVQNSGDFPCPPLPMAIVMDGFAPIKIISPSNGFAPIKIIKSKRHIKKTGTVPYIGNFM